MNIPVSQVIPQTREVATSSSENQTSNEENGALFSELMDSGLELNASQEAEETQKATEQAEVDLMSMMGQMPIIVPTMEANEEKPLLIDNVTIENQEGTELRGELSTLATNQTQQLGSEWNTQESSTVSPADGEIMLDSLTMTEIEEQVVKAVQFQQVSNQALSKENIKWTEAPKLISDNDEAGLELIAGVPVSSEPTENPYDLLKNPVTRVIETVTLEAEVHSEAQTQAFTEMTKESVEPLPDLKISNTVEGFSQVAQPTTTAKEVITQPTTVKWENQLEFEELMIKQASLLKEGESTNLVIKLKPYTLGEMQISLEMKDGQLKGLIELENIEAKKIVEENLKMLQGDLKNSIIEVEQMSPQLKDGGEYEGNSQKEQRFKEEEKRKQTSEQENFKELLNESREVAVELVV